MSLSFIGSFTSSSRFSISNNCVGTEVSIGMDRASNNLVSACDQIKQSCLGYEKRVFVVETIGRSCGFQALFGAICAGSVRKKTFYVRLSFRR